MVNFPRVEAVILDFYHAAEYLAKLAQALNPDDEEAAVEQTKAWSRIQRDEGGEVMIAVLEGWDWPTRKGLVSIREEVLGSFRNQVHRMDYPTYEDNGWSIGSGAVVSACKTLVGPRLKGPGMQWVNPAAIPCATSAPCTAANWVSGPPSGAVTLPLETNFYQQK